MIIIIKATLSPTVIKKKKKNTRGMFMLFLFYSLVLFFMAKI